MLDSEARTGSGRKEGAPCLSVSSLAIEFPALLTFLWDPASTSPGRGARAGSSGARRARWASHGSTARRTRSGAFLELGVSKTAIAKLTGVSRTALYSFMTTRGLRPSLHEILAGMVT